MKTEDIQLIRNKIEKSKIIIGKQRDLLRELHSELETILESLDGAKDDFELANQYFESGMDRLSEQM